MTSLTENPYYHELIFNLFFLQPGRTGAQRKLSLTEKLSASPESFLIDRHIDETYLQNLQNFSFGRFELGLLVTLAFVTGVTQRDVYITFVTVTSLLGYIFGLPKLFLVFKKSFSFGEGCLVLQVILLYTAHSFIHLHNDNNSGQLLLEVGCNGNANCYIIQYLSITLYKCSSSGSISGHQSATGTLALLSRLLILSTGSIFQIRFLFGHYCYSSEAIHNDNNLY